ncbi:helix-turn-helix domain-containing protein [Corticibacter populi]|nr:AraC family transcriptional regulator [Corticibacter populi]RZS33265.1 AraC family transcriptional regulator [Corticibacter populi]
MPSPRSKLPVTAAPAAGEIARPVYRQDIEQFVQRFDGGLTTDYRFKNRQPLSSEPLLDGVFETLALDGLFLHCVDARDLADRVTESALQPGIKAVLLCAGNTDVVYGQHRYWLGNRADNSGRTINEAALVSYAEPDVFRRYWRHGRTERKISLTITPDWLQEHLHEFANNSAMAEPLRKFQQLHMATTPWQPSAYALNLAQQLLAPPVFCASMQRLYRQARTYDLVLEVLSRFLCTDSAVQSKAMTARLTARELRQVSQLTELLRTEAVNGLSMPEILRMAGIGSSRIHRHFRQVHGCSIFGYMQQRRMNKAYAALQKDGVSVALAAELAGYASAANFSTAFKRMFGITPRQAWTRR